MAFIVGWTHPPAGSIPPTKSFAVSELRHNQRDIITLFVGAELPNLIQYRCQQSLARLFAMSPQSFDQATLAEFLSGCVRGFRHSIGVERKHVAGEDPTLSHGAIPVRKDPQERSGGFQLPHGGIPSA